MVNGFYNEPKTIFNSIFQLLVTEFIKNKLIEKQELWSQLDSVQNKHLNEQIIIYI